MARPKMDKKIKRDKCVMVRFTDAEHDLITDYARDMHLSPAECVRERALHTRVTVKYDMATRLDDIKPLTEEFHKIGVNLNQIAHHLNAGDPMSEKTILEIRDYLEDLRNLRDEVLIMTDNL